MNRASLLFAPLAAALAACGSVVVVPVDPRADAAPTPDVAPPDAVVPNDNGVTPPPPPVDVPPTLDVPPSLDVTSPDVAPPPPPGALARACQNFCQRGNAVCRTSADCAALCRDALAQPGVVRCPAEALAMLTCGVNRNAFVCRPSRNTFELDTATCAGPSAAYERCANGTPPPPPPVDGGMDPLRAACAQVCDRMARDCGTASSGCVDQCAMVGAAPSYAMCSAQILGVYDCVARNGVTCGPMGMNQPAPACAPLINAAQMCLNGGIDPPPPPPPVDGGPAPTYPGCVDACALADRACGTSDPGCAADCSDAGSMLGGTCRRVFDEMLACVRRNGFTCRGGSPQPASACDALVMRLQMCGGSGGGTPPMPTVDAGAPDR